MTQSRTIRDWFLCSIQVRFCMDVYLQLYTVYCHNGAMFALFKHWLYSIVARHRHSAISHVRLQHQMKFQPFVCSICYRSNCARIHGTCSRNCTAEFTWNKWNKGNFFPPRLYMCVFSLLLRFSSINFSIIIRYLIVYLLFPLLCYSCILTLLSILHFIL